MLEFKQELTGEMSKEDYYQMKKSIALAKKIFFYSLSFALACFGISIFIRLLEKLF